MQSSDLAWISVDDMQTWQDFREIFEESDVSKVVASKVSPLHERVQLYSSFYVVRSRCSDANWHADWPPGVGTSAWTLLAPIEEYQTGDFQLLYRNSAGKVEQYRYREGEAILFGSHFMHSTEPGCSVDGAEAPHVFLCFTFGSDDLDSTSNTSPPQSVATKAASWWRRLGTANGRASICRRRRRRRSSSRTRRRRGMLLLVCQARVRRVRP